MSVRPYLSKVCAASALLLSIASSACERIRPKLDETRIACGFSAKQAHGSSIFIITDTDGGLLPRSDLRVLSKGPGDPQSFSLSREGCLLIHHGRRATISVRDGRPGRYSGIILTSSDGSVGRVSKVALKPFRSEAGFENCGIHGTARLGWIRLQRAGGGVILKDELRASSLAPYGSSSKGSLEVSDLGCVFMEENQEGLAVALDGKGSAYLGRIEREQGLAELDEKIAPSLFQECRSSPREPLRTAILDRRLIVFSPSDSSRNLPSGSGATTRWSICAEESGCPRSTWLGIDETLSDAGQAFGRCVAVRANTSKDAGRRILRRDSTFNGASTSEVAEIGRGMPQDEVTQVIKLDLSQFRSAESSVRSMTIRFPQCIAGTISLTRHSRLLIQIRSGQQDKPLASGSSIVLNVGTKSGNVLIEGTEAFEASRDATLGSSIRTVAFPVGSNMAEDLLAEYLDSKQTLAFTVHLRDAFGQTAQLTSWDPCVLQVTRPLAESGDLTLRRNAVTFDKEGLFQIIPERSQALLDGVQFAYALTPALDSRGSGQASASFDTQENCLASGDFEHARGETIPLPQEGRFELRLRACARNGTSVDLEPRRIHVNGRHPKFHIRPNPTMQFSGTLTSLGEPAFLRVEGLDDDVMSTDEMLSGIGCAAEAQISGHRETVPARCQVHQRIVGESSAILKLDWDGQFLLSSSAHPTGLRVHVSVPTGDEREPRVSSRFDLPIYGSALGTAFYVGAFLTLDLALEGSAS